jgi:hypothetical protein
VNLGISNNSHHKQRQRSSLRPSSIYIPTDVQSTSSSWCRTPFGAHDQILISYVWQLKLHNEELHDLYSSSSIIRVVKSRMTWVGHVARMGEKRNAYRLLVGKPEGKRPLWRPRRRWVDIRLDLVEVAWNDVDWICLAQDMDRWRALVNSVLIRLP